MIAAPAAMRRYAAPIVRDETITKATLRPEPGGNAMMKPSLAWLSFALGLVAASAAAAQDYPARAVRLIVPFAPGGPADMLARAIAPSLSVALKQPITIENKGGAGGAIGVDTVLKSPADGYTIGLTGPGALVSLPFMTNLPYNVERDVAPIVRVATVSGVIVAGPKSGFKSLADLVAYARTRPGQVHFGSAGSGTTTHLAGELLNMEAGIKLVHVPYRGAAPALADMLGGHVQLMLPDLPAVLEQIRAGAVNGLAITSPNRSPFVPDLPTTTELGFPQVISYSWYGLIAPAGTPAAVRARIQAVTMEALASPDVLAQIATLGGTPTPGTGEEFASSISSEQKKWKRVIDATGAIE
jgi:tripartite-type tricarboxylate transporter receptor subunit TctC